MSDYPRDEFDKVPESSARQGVHRARMVPPRQGGLGLIILVGVLALAIGAAAFFVAPRLGLGAASSAAPTAEAVAEAAAEATESAPAPTASPAPSTPGAPATTEAPATETPAPAPETPAPTTSAPAPLDKAQPVNVLNGTGVGGLAGTVAGRVSGDGWATGQVGNWTGQPLQTSIIFYNGPQQLAAAQELSRLLSIPTLIESPLVSPQVTVVVGPGFQ